MVLVGWPDSEYLIWRSIGLGRPKVSWKWWLFRSSSRSHPRVQNRSESNSLVSVRLLVTRRAYSCKIGGWRKLIVNDDSWSAPGKSQRFWNSKKRGAISMRKKTYGSTKLDHSKLYESSRRKPGWRFTAGVKYGVSGELVLSFQENDNSGNFGAKIKYA